MDHTDMAVYRNDLCGSVVFGVLCSLLVMRVCEGQGKFIPLFNAPINVMPYYHRYGLRWGFAFLKITIPHQLGKYWRCKPPLTPTYLPVAKPGVSGDLHDHPYVSWFFGYQCKRALY